MSDIYSSNWLDAETNLAGDSTSTVSKILNLRGATEGSLFVKQASGDLAGMVLTFEFTDKLNPDASDWYTKVWTSTGSFEWVIGPLSSGNQIIQGSSFSIDCMRVKVSTASTLPSTFDLILIGK